MECAAATIASIELSNSIHRLLTKVTLNLESFSNAPETLERLRSELWAIEKLHISSDFFDRRPKRNTYSARKDPKSALLQLAKELAAELQDLKDGLPSTKTSGHLAPHHGRLLIKLDKSKLSERINKIADYREYWARLLDVSQSPVSVKDFLQWLSPPDFFSRHETLLQSAASSSSSWVLESNVLKEWVGSPGKTLWCTGRPLPSTNSHGSWHRKIGPMVGVLT
ncbi:uncharacterized protein LY79DRAFT_410641 [Colletotrichum navitas]|uniref:Uncharacterized protein n=1 Tax=Colletotrichum navitas TaxID=681940 RepID=A0AAD8PNN6_9PEZI|nr:uncharacterized protein LY79DRAFT_410641 [Colletotrichum navitas]KAK1573549.1 hypothetical protein LY79DRAFT_410641 [Colletotrichum navitas]